MILEAAIQALTGPLSRRVFRPLMRDRATIFMLHRRTNPACGISGHTPEFLREVLYTLRKSGAQFVSLRTLVDCWRHGDPGRPNWIAFTMDDGFADQADFVNEAFAPTGCPVTLFLITGFVDGLLWPWDDQLAYVFKNAAAQTAQVRVGPHQIDVDLRTAQSRHMSLRDVRERCKTIPNDDLYALVKNIAHSLRAEVPASPPAEYAPLTWDAARSLEAQGVEIGPHSVSHRIVSRLSDEEVRREIQGSWQRLQEELARPLPIFCWPTGRWQDVSERDIVLADQSGLHASVSTDSDYAHIPPDADQMSRHRIKRFGLPNDIATVLRYGSWLERGRQLLQISR